MSSPLQQRLRIIDELCDRYEADWRARRASTIQDYLEGLEEGPVRQALLYELVLLDQELSQAAGEMRTLQDYRLQEPDQALLLELSTDLVAPPPANEPETQQAKNTGPAGTRSPSRRVDNASP